MTSQVCGAAGNVSIQTRTGAVDTTRPRTEQLHFQPRGVDYMLLYFVFVALSQVSPHVTNDSGGLKLFTDLQVWTLNLILSPAQTLCRTDLLLLFLLQVTGLNFSFIQQTCSRVPDSLCLGGVTDGAASVGSTSRGSAAC